MSKKRIIWISVSALLLVAIGILIFVLTAKPTTYSYTGHIIAVRDSDDGKVITTLYGNKQSEFTIKWYTKKAFEGGLTELKEGAFIKLNTTKKSETNVKNFLAYEGFSMTGTIVYLEGETKPYILTFGTVVNYYSLYALIPSDDTDYNLETGMQVKIHYQYELNASIEQIVVDAITPTSEDIATFTEEEMNFIQRKGYTIAK